MPSIRIASRRVLLDDGRVAPAVIAVTPPRIETIEEGATAADVEYGDRLVTPAFVNAHTHLALGALRTLVSDASTRGNVVEDLFFRFERRLSREDVRAFVRMGAYESILSGVGCVWDHYYFGEAVAAGLRDVGLAGVVAPTLQDLDGPGSGDSERQLEATAAIDDDHELAAAGIVAAVGPHATDTVGAKLLDRALALAEERDLPLHMHLAQSLEELERSEQRHGTSPAAWLERRGVLARAPSLVLAHGVFVDDRDLARLGPKHTLVWCPRSAAQFGIPARPERWAAAGVRWAVATDCGATNDTMSPQAELASLLGHRAAAATHHPAYEAFLTGHPAEAAAVWAARHEAFDALAPLVDSRALLSRLWSVPGAMHPKMPTGSLRPGALASLAVWDLEHPSVWPAREPLRALALANATPALWAMWIAGRQVGRDGALGELSRSDAYRAAREEADARLAALTADG